MITEKMIEKAARVVFAEYYPQGYGDIKTYDDAPESHKANLRRNAKAALEAAFAEMSNNYLIFKSKHEKEKVYNQGYINGFNDGWYAFRDELTAEAQRLGLYDNPPKEKETL